jgi:xylose isomerase
VDGVKDFARGSMRSYLIYKEKARRFNEDKEIRAILKDLQNVPTNGLPRLNGYSKAAAKALKSATFDRKALGARGLAYERLDQLTLEVLLGIR